VLPTLPLELGDARLREALDAMPHKVWMVRLDGPAVYYNRAMRDFAGSAIRLPDRASRERALVHADDLPRFIISRDEALASDLDWSVEVRLKCENLQRAGSYKVRGALVRISRLTPDERARGVVAASAGNHAQGVAVAAGICRTTATVFMPLGAPLPKVAATKGYGAKVRLVGDTVDEALVAAASYAAEK